ncbi:MAG: anthranilate phosphoribosyltransferase [Bacteroidota bacterium]
MTPYLKTLSTGTTLSSSEAEAAMTHMLNGEAEPVEIAGLLMGLRTRGETLDELTGFTRVMRAHAVHVDAPEGAIDLCGTGGDGTGTFNISTTAAFVAAGAGVPVAKHGNRSVSSRCGSADVLEALGVNAGLRKDGVERCLREAGIAFLFAPYFHPALKHVMPVRRTLKARTFFNILGPLCNPASVSRQLVGAFSQEVAEQMAHILLRLGAERVATVWSQDHLDELSISAPSHVYLAKAGDEAPRPMTVTPEQFGFERASASTLAGGDAQDNAAILRAILSGEPGPKRDVTLLNAGFALYTSGQFDSIEAAIDAARTSIDTGAAQEKLDALIKTSNA